MFTILSNLSKDVKIFTLNLIQPFIELLGEDDNDEVKSKDVVSKLSFSSYPSWTHHESNSPTTNPFGIIAESSPNFIRSFVVESISGCIKALPPPVKSFVITSIGHLKPLVDTIASSGILDGAITDDNLLRLPISIESILVATTTSELFVASSTDLVSANDRTSLAGVNDDEESYYFKALKCVVVIGCFVILLAFGCGIIRLNTTILCLAIFQAILLEYNYQMISSFVAVMMKYLNMIFGVYSNVDSNDMDKVAEGEELAVSTLRSSSLCLDMSSSASSNELVVPSNISFDADTTVVNRSVSSDESIVMPCKPYFVAFLLLIFASLVGMMDTLSADRFDWLGLLSLVASNIIMTTSSKQSVLGSNVETTINASLSSALDDIHDATLASRSADDIQSQSPFNLIGTLRACLYSGLQHIQHDLLVAFLLMASAPLLVMVAVLMVLLDFRSILQALVIITCLIYAVTYISKALQSIPTYLRGSTNALVSRVYRFDTTITTICNIITDESCLLTLLLMVTVPLMGVVVVMMMLILASFNWSLVVQVLVECTMLPSCLTSITQACGVVTLMMCLKIISYYLLRLWQYQLCIALNFFDVIGASTSLVNRMSWLFAVISFALAYYDDDSGGVHTTRGGISATVHNVTPPGRLMNTARDILHSASAYTLNSIWMILAWVVKKFVYLIVYTSILLIHVFIMLVQFIDFKAVIYTYLIRQPINIIWRIIGRLAVTLLGCVVYLYTNIKLLVLAPFNQVEQKEPPLPPVGIAVSDDEDSEDDDSTIEFGAAADQIDCFGIDLDITLSPPPPPKRRARRRRKEYPPAVWHRGRGGRGGRLRPRIRPIR